MTLFGPETRNWHGWEIPVKYTPDNISACRGCHELVVWCTTQNGRPTPVNRDGTSHFATCPQAAQFRRRR